MGKSPGKWIKSVFTRKKVGKSGLSKGKEISVSVPNRDEASNLDEVPISISEPVLVSGGKVNSGLEKGKFARLPSIGAILASPKQEVVVETAADQELPPPPSSSESSDAERMRLEQAATKVQAGVRGFLARREYRSREDIVSLQALIRGHLVRRQAVATIYCTQGIVKFQALVRGQIVRSSDIGMQVHSKLTVEEDKDAKELESGQLSGDGRARIFVENAFVAKLLSLSPTVMPLLLQYGPEEPNSTSKWLGRWTASRIWEPKSHPKKVPPTKQRKVETGKPKAKRSVGRLHSGTGENGSSNNTPDSEKQKRITKKISNSSGHSSQGYSPNEIEKAKNNLKKISSSSRDIHSKKEVDTEKRQDDSKQNLLSPALSGQSYDSQLDKQPVDLESDVPKISDQAISNPVEHPIQVSEGNADILTVDDDFRDDFSADKQPTSEISDQAISNPVEHPKQVSEGNADILTLDGDFQDDLSGDEKIKVSKRRASLPAKHIHQDADLPIVTVPKDDQTSNGNNKVPKRRASLPAKHDEEVSLPSETKVPSYMAITESAKAKFRGQVSVSPRFGQDASYEKNGIARRYSLPSSNSGKLTSSPRVQSLVQATSGKGAIKIDRSLSSSRDGKAIQAEWRR